MYVLEMVHPPPIQEDRGRWIKVFADLEEQEREHSARLPRLTWLQSL